MSTYCRISTSEMQELLKTEKGWKTEMAGKEIVFSFNLKSYPFIQVKVFSSIKLDTGVGRDLGKDAIRVCAVNVARNIGWIKVSRVYRTTNWRENLKSRITEVIEKSKQRFN